MHSYQWFSGKEFAFSAGDEEDVGSIAGLGRSPGDENGYLLEYSCQKKPMGRGPSWATVCGVAESDMTEHIHML